MHQIGYGNRSIADRDRRQYALSRLSRRDLAEAIGVHYQTVGYLERGEYNPSLSLAMSICDFFGLPVEAVFSFDEFTPLSEVVYERSSE